LLQKGNNSFKNFIKFQNSKINKKNNKVQNFQKISILQNFLKKKSKFSKDIKFFKKISTFLIFFIDFRILKFYDIFERVISLLKQAMGCLPGNNRVVTR
jgi:hypothetical protein